MNAGLSNLETLKRHLLASGLASDTRFDVPIRMIGLAVAGLFDAITNRKLAFLEDDTVVITANREHFTVPRYPIADDVTVETRSANSESWVEQTDEPYITNYQTGLIQFSGTLGSSSSQIQLTWSGGYWFDPLDPEEAGYPTAVPQDATLLPDDLQGAFLLQCEQVWSVRDKLGTDIVEAGSGHAAKLGGLELVPLVHQILLPYIRYQLS